LEAVCTDINHFSNRQLRRYKGNLSEFVKAVPAAKSYYKLEAATLRFRYLLALNWCMWNLSEFVKAVPAAKSYYK
jgi:ATPase subunit of ABC transporter with duplicated ATPase domains